MKPDQLRKLKVILKAKFECERAKAEPLISTERKLRRDLAKLAAQDRAARQEEKALEQMRPLGADLVWGLWVDRKRREMTVELAKVLVEKERVHRELRQHFGRTCAAEAVYSDNVGKQPVTASVSEEILSRFVIKK